MSLEIVEQLNPDNMAELQWDVGTDGFVYPEPVLHVARSFNDADYHNLVGEARGHVHRDKTTSIVYGEWNNPNDSPTEVVVMFSTYATTIDDNMALRGKFTYEALQAAGITDEKERPLPLLFLGAPAGDGRYNLNKQQRKQVAAGDLAPAAANQLELVRRKGFGTVAMLGFSQGGSMAAAGARIAHSKELDVSAIGAASVPNIVERGRWALQMAFASQAPHLREDLKKGGIEAFKRVHREQYSEIKYARAMLSQPRENLALFRGLTHDKFGEDLEAALQQFPDLQATISVAAGKGDRVGLEGPTRTTLHNLRHDAQELGAELPHFVAIEKGYHSWGDRVQVLGAFYLYAVARGTTG
jgi:hypothetical protein